MPIFYKVSKDKLIDCQLSLLSDNRPSDQLAYDLILETLLAK
uniref:Uncharacterized protein n=1 Tax=Arundo donax TaxID=35708 RepID=A0A0A9H4B8_ARUDO